MTDKSVPGLTAALASAARIEQLELENFRLTGALQEATYKLQAWRDIDGEALMLAERRGMSDQQSKTLTELEEIAAIGEQRGLERAAEIAEKAAAPMNEKSHYQYAYKAALVAIAQEIRAAGKAGA